MLTFSLSKEVETLVYGLVPKEVNKACVVDPSVANWRKKETPFISGKPALVAIKGPLLEPSIACDSSQSGMIKLKLIIRMSKFFQ